LKTKQIKFSEKFWDWAIGLPLFPSEAGLPPCIAWPVYLKGAGQLVLPPLPTHFVRN
jgi:hypothetical protein